MSDVLAVDAGGTSTRAVVVDADGRCLGYGRAAGGNPTSAGAAAAIASVGAAIEQALAAPAVVPASVTTVLVANAGGHPDFVPGIERRVAALGVPAPVVRVGDLLALFASGTHETEGAALIAGTGAIGGALRNGRIARTVDGTGWLLGDGGSGFWIGHRVARAVVDDLDGGPSTGLTGSLLPRFGLVRDAEGERTIVDGRPVVLGRLVARLYELRPVQLSALAPLAFALAEEDEVAGAIVREAVALLATLLLRVRRVQSEGPLVFGGSVLVEGVLRLPASTTSPLLDAAGGTVPVPVPDGLVGAAVLALREAGIEVGAARFAALSASVRAAGGGWTPPVAGP